ncbi:MAG: VOC family protein [Rhodospirillales bacterium]|nr:VOC family protein [Rhodospirillales bacterium]
MSNFNVLRTNHTSFTVSDLDRIIGFFCDGLGFQLLNRAPRDPKLVQQISGVAGADIEVAYIQGPAHRLELIQYHGPADRGRVECRPCDAGYAHLAYDVDNVDAAMAAARAYTFKELGAPVAIDKGPNTGSRVVYMRDIDGITVEFIEKAA